MNNYLKNTIFIYKDNKEIKKIDIRKITKDIYKFYKTINLETLYEIYKKNNIYKDKNMIIRYVNKYIKKERCIKIKFIGYRTTYNIKILIKNNLEFKIYHYINDIILYINLLYNNYNIKEKINKQIYIKEIKELKIYEKKITKSGLLKKKKYKLYEIIEKIKFII